MAVGTRSVSHNFILLLTLLFRSRNRAASMDVCDLGNLTVMNASQDSRVLTVDRLSVVTFACWTWCGFVDWDTITLSGQQVPATGVAQYNCTGVSGPCQPFRTRPQCDDVEPERDNILKYELSLLANETFYIECHPQCTYRGADKKEGRTSGLLVHVVDPPKPTLVTPTQSAAVTSTKDVSSCDQPTKTMPSSTATSTTTSHIPPILTSSDPPKAVSTSISTSSVVTIIPTSLQPQTTTNYPDMRSIVGAQVMPSQTVHVADAGSTTTLLSIVAVVFFVLFVIVLVLFFILLIFFINVKRRIVDIKLHQRQQSSQTPSKDFPETSISQL